MKSVALDSAYISRRGNRHVFQYVILFVLILVAIIGCSEIEALDVGRYFEEARSTATADWKTIFNYRFSQRRDFIYFFILHLAVILHLPLPLVSAVIVFLYYFLVIKTVKLFKSEKLDNHVWLVILFSAPLMWVSSISRNLTSFMFMYCSVYFFYKKKWLWMFFFSAVSVFTHFSVLLYIAILYSSVLFNKVHVNTKVMFVVLVGLLILGRLMPMQIQIFMIQFFEGSDIRYASYTVFENQELMYTTNLSLGDRLLPIFAFIFSIVLLLLNKNQGFEYWVLFVLTILFSFFIASNQLFVQRCIMAMPMFWGLNVASIYASYPQKRKILNTISWIGLTFIALNFYTGRTMFMI